MHFYFTYLAKKTHDFSDAPVLTNYSKDILVESGKSLSLFCNWDGNPEPIKTTWTKKGLYAVLSESSSLNINNVTQNQAGIYNCNAESSVEYFLTFFIFLYTKLII